MTLNEWFNSNHGYDEAKGYDRNGDEIPYVEGDDDPIYDAIVTAVIPADDYHMKALVYLDFER